MALTSDNQQLKIEYKASATLSKFHRSSAFYRGLRGPVRSGKSSGACADIMMLAKQQMPDPVDGIRRTRWLVVRNTYRELLDTTLKTWLAWWPEVIFGTYNYGRMIHNIVIDDLEMEVMFRALDRPDDVKKLLSLEVTGAWVNEAREVPRAIINTLGDRVGQYPKRRKEIDYGCTWGGVIMDTNAPDDDHWWFDLEAKPPKGWAFFVQPGALIEIEEGKFVINPKAENLDNLNEGRNYYLKRMAGKRPGYIRVYYCNQFGFAEEGRRVHPEYSDSVHCSAVPLIPDKDHEVVIGLDFGLTPAAALFSRRPSGQWWLFKELATEDIGIKQFAEMLLLPYINRHLTDFKISIYGDTHGNTGSQNDKKTPGQILNALGIDVKMPKLGNGPTLRREALAQPFGRLINGQPGLILDPGCKVLRKGLSAKFYYKRLQVVGDEKYHDMPDKNFWSHVCEAAEHAMVGAGEGKLLTRKQIPKSTPRRSMGPKAHGWMGS